MITKTFQQNIAAFLFVVLILVNPAINAQTLAINEFMSSNNTTIADEDGEYQDWIELYNFGAEPINLSGYGLSDDMDEPFKWTFPSGLTIQAGGFLMVWASGKNRTNPTAALHTNFSIKADGEELVLTHPNGLQLDEVMPVVLPTDISYGRFANGTGQWYYFDNPSPGQSNSNNGYSGITAAPVFSQNGGTYTENFTLNIEAQTGATIYFTTNGNYPEPELATVFSTPFQVSNTTMIRAKAYKQNELPSPTVTMVYSKIGEQVQNFKTNLPVIILHQFNQPITPGDRTPAVAVFLENNQGDSTTLTGEIALHSRIMANVRGRSSQMFPKKMFGFHLKNEEDGDRDASLFGMSEDHNWILNGPYTDKTLMRNVLAYDLGNQLERYSPRTQFVEVFLHSGTGPLTNSHYHGVYVLVERIKISEERVNIAKLAPGDNAEPEISGGYIIKMDWMDEGENGFWTNTGGQFSFVRPAEDEISQPQKLWIQNYINQFETALNGPNFTDPEIGYEKYIDSDSFIDHFLITELFKEIDGYRLSTYMYKDRNGKLIMGPLWDFNLSLGNANYYQAWNPAGWYYTTVSNIHCGNWFQRLLLDPAFTARVKYRWWQLRQDIFLDEHLSDMIFNNKEILAEAQTRNFQRWPILGQWVWPNWYVGSTYNDEVNWMHNWLMQRTAWIDNQYGPPPVFQDYELVNFWLFDANLPNDTPLEEITSTFSILEDGLLEFHSALNGYPFDPEHPNWRKASMERRNSPTPLNYRPEGNNGITYANSEMRGLQIKQPFTGDGGVNTMIFHVSTTGFENVVFKFAAKDEGAADNLIVDYSVAEGNPMWTNSGLSNPTPSLTPTYQLFTFDFSAIESTDNNPHFKIRVRFDGNNMSADEGNRVTFNNMSLDGVSIYGGNLPPYVSNAVSLQEVIESGNSVLIDLNDVFTDPDDDPLVFTASSSHPEMVVASLNGSILTIQPQRRGEATISLTATDQVYPQISTSFRVLVYPEAHPLSQGLFTFNFWGPNEPEYSYPQNMIFLQSDTDDHELDEPLHFAYYIPHDDYHPDDIPTVGFPYNNTRRTRLNGLGEEGISFINTGRARDLGGALLAVDTRGISDAVIDWLAGTIVQNERVYALRLQYRSNISEPFADLLELGNVVEYVAGSDGEVQLYEDVYLPADALGKEYVQLLWRYYLVEGDAGPRAQLRLDDIIFKDVTGINNPDEKGFKAYFDGNAIQIRFSNSFSGTILVYDATGRLIANTETENSNHRSIDINSAKGIYIIRLLGDAYNTSGKILVY